MGNTTSGILLPIGAIAARTGLSVPTIRYYEAEGLVFPLRTAAGQRQFRRADIRRLSFVMIAQKLGFSLSEIREELTPLPQNRAPTKRDWTRIANHFHKRLGRRIATLELLRDRLDGCIGCGCLSLDNCHLYNPDDIAAQAGHGTL
jgi:MerR family redox-sensitive transcriptional activator SoxR